MSRRKMTDKEREEFMEYKLRFCQELMDEAMEFFVKQTTVSEDRKFHACAEAGFAIENLVEGGEELTQEGNWKVGMIDMNVGHLANLGWLLLYSPPSVREQLYKHVEAYWRTYSDPNEIEF